MWLAVGAIVAGFALLVWGADRFVIGAAALARNLGISPLLIGLTVVGFGTSAPEILVSTMAAYQGNPGLGIGNAIGSNIANIGLILGITALIAPLSVHSGVLRREYPLLLGVSIAVYVLLWDGTLDRIDGAILLGGLLAVLYYIVTIARSRAATDPMAGEFDAEIPQDLGTFAATAWFVVGLAILLVSSRMLVWGAVEIAQTFGVSDLVIGLTIVAIGTSLPELAASIMSALKNEHDIAIGNVIGSNLYNLLAVLAMPGLISSAAVDGDVLVRDMPMMLLLTIALYFMGRSGRNGGDINRLEGFVLTATFLAYLGYVYYQAQPHLA